MTEADIIARIVVDLPPKPTDADWLRALSKAYQGGKEGEYERGFKAGVVVGSNTSLRSINAVFDVMKPKTAQSVDAYNEEASRDL